MSWTLSQSFSGCFGLYCSTYLDNWEPAIEAVCLVLKAAEKNSVTASIIQHFVRLSSEIEFTLISKLNVRLSRHFSVIKAKKSICLDNWHFSVIGDILGALVIPIGIRLYEVICCFYNERSVLKVLLYFYYLQVVTLQLNKVNINDNKVK